jgi:glycosyltransferase involved in cell wall biosynthesis
MNPKVSIIVPIFNMEQYLDRCLESLFTQRLTDIEIIAVNDGSNDSSLSILEEYARIDSRIIIIDKQIGSTLRCIKPCMNRQSRLILTL